ncbi:hypothetical protein J4E93_010454 [Alternaria ventricosa]|uniref:uncharacterized protein n=1 Tax=Alternaria ventricosa TaxID=1187951 RepID=UPI0020C34E66|nr:uncharacterized protein J4E93_010454 [Alternaria ventricosa]KAI4638144.1 hypothetical protein J4E93_010454 [Alternaria ventricosa]
MSDLNAMGMIARITIEPNDGAEAIWLKKLVTSIFATEIVILSYLAYAQGIPNAPNVSRIIELTTLVGVEPTTWRDAIDEVRTVTVRQQLLRSNNVACVGIELEQKYLKGFAKERICNHGSYLTKSTWQILNSSAQRSHEALAMLRNEHEEARKQLEELTRQVVKASGAPAPADGVNDGGDTEEIQATLLSIQPEVAQSSPGVEINSG